MSRPRSPRHVTSRPVVPLFKPGGIRAARQIHLGADEFEALRLADVEGLQQAEAAARMGVSRQTFGRVLASARRKAATALVRGLALRIEGASRPGSDARTALASRCGSNSDDCARCTQPLVRLRRKGATVPLVR